MWGLFLAFFFFFFLMVKLKTSGRIAQHRWDEQREKLHSALLTHPLLIYIVLCCEKESGAQDKAEPFIPIQRQIFNVQSKPSKGHTSPL